MGSLMRITCIAAALLALGAGSAFAADPNTFPATGAVGLGTSVPAGATHLHVKSTTNATDGGLVRMEVPDYTFANQIDFYDAGGARGFLGFRGVNATAPWNAIGLYLINKDNSNLIMGTNGVEQARIDLNGNVGIGSTSPLARLHVVGQVANEVARFQARTDASNNRSFFSLMNTNPSFWWEFSAQDASGGALKNGLAFRERSGSGASLERLYIASGGNVGIGTTSPDVTLQVANPATIETPTTQDVFKLVNLYSNYSYPQAASFALGSYATNGGANAWGPSTRLDIKLKSAKAITYATDMTVMTLQDNGSVGIGTASPATTLHVRTNAQGTDGIVAENVAGGLIRFLPNAGASNYNSLVQAGDTALIYTHGAADSGTLVIAPHSASGTLKGIRITAAGNVGIGVAAPTSALAVNGLISAKEIKVVASPADYVFADGYRLRPLAEVEAFITAHKHLPGVPSAKEQEEQGEMVADLMRAHLEKIEELNLYVIQQQKVIDALVAQAKTAAETMQRQDTALTHVLSKLAAIEADRVP
jgi:hypothetical protein